MNISDEKKTTVTKALKNYAAENNITDLQLGGIINSMPLIGAKVSALTQKEIDEIKSSIPKEELQRITKILSEVK